MSSEQQMDLEQAVPSLGAPNLQQLGKPVTPEPVIDSEESKSQQRGGSVESERMIEPEKRKQKPANYPTAELQALHDLLVELIKKQDLPRKKGFYNAARADHAHYFSIMGLLLASSTYLIVSLTREDVDRWWYEFLATSIGLDLVGIFFIILFSWKNYRGESKELRDGDTGNHIPHRDCHGLFHVILLASVSLTFAGSYGALFYASRLK